MSKPGDKIGLLYKKLVGEWQKGETRDLSTVDKLISNLKGEFVMIGMAGTVSGDVEVNILQMQREVAEIAVQLYALKKDIEGFQRAMGQLKSFYASFAEKLDGAIGESSAKYHMLGLDLMCLLALNNLPAFHMELERIPTRIALESPYISFPVGLEQALIEGAYNKIFLSKANLPSQYYSCFMDMLLDTVRDEIADCMEKAYKTLTCKEAGRLMFLDGADLLIKTAAYGKKREWRLSKDKASFLFGSEDTHDSDGVLDARRLVCQNIFYAKQLEMIP